MSKIRIGIFFGGSSREREVSFAGGRTVFDNLDKGYFEAIPIFIDSFGRFIQLDWQNVYKGSIRDFYPPASFLPDTENEFQMYAESLNPDSTMQETMAAAIGKELQPTELTDVIDFAFLALHGVYGEDGSIQGLLEWLKIPYSGSGIFASALGMNKAKQKDFQERAGLFVNNYQTLSRNAWVNGDEDHKADLYKFYNLTFHEQFVIKPANQGSSLGISVLKHPDYAAFETAMDLAFFRMHVNSSEWISLSNFDKTLFVKDIADIRKGLGLPLKCNGEFIYLPSGLLEKLNNEAATSETILLEAIENETEVVIEEFINGREFSCIVVRDDSGNPLALPPTEIRKQTDLFDYRSKYLPGLSHKETPIKAPDFVVHEIREACIALFDYFGFNVYARIDGFIDADNEIFLNDPNTTSGMMPSSFFFHQAAEIGLNPSQFLTFIIRSSLAERRNTHTFSAPAARLLQMLDAEINAGAVALNNRRKIAVIMGGYSFERHISMESGRNVYEKLSSSAEFEPIPLFLTGNADFIELYKLPVNLMLKDNVDDIRDKVSNYEPSVVLEEIIAEASELTARYNPLGAQFEPEKVELSTLPSICEGVFLALHGRPGEDGTLQRELQKLGLYYNGSDAESSAITIHKYNTNEILRNAGFLVADHMLISKDAWLADTEKYEADILQQFGLPLIAKPADDGCSAAVRKVKTAEELHNFISAIFRNTPVLDGNLRQSLGLSANEEFPLKQELLIEKFIDKSDADKFLEITGGLVTHILAEGSLSYEIFEPSESLADSEILSLEEKFLAGEGQNITPSRFSSNPTEQLRISKEVKTCFEKVARALNVKGYCRIDAFVKIYNSGQVDIIIIEVNSLPGMTPATCIYHQAAINNYRPFEFITQILNFGRQSMPKHA